MSTLFLHIGMAKTGTTAIQNLLADNRAVLEKHGICFPDFGLSYERINDLRNAHFLTSMLAEHKFDTQEVARLTTDDYEKALDMLVELSQTHDRIILSDEALWRCSTFHSRFWHQLKDDLKERGIELKVIVYLRRQDLFTESLWAQKVKNQVLQSEFTEYLQFMYDIHYPLDYYANIKHILEAVDHSALTIRIYERNQFTGPEKNLFSDFLGLFGLTMSDGFQVKTEIYNTRLDGIYLEMKRILNYLPDFLGQNHLIVRTMKNIQPLVSGQSTFDYFKPMQRKIFLDSFAESNQKLAREYLSREDGILFYDEFKELPTFEADQQELLKSTIIVYGKAIETLATRNKKLRKDLRELRQEVKELRKLCEESPWYRLQRKMNHNAQKTK